MSTNWKKEVQLFLFAKDMIVYLRNAKTSTRKLETIKTFSKVAWSKINLEKSVAFLYTNKNQQKKEFKETFTFTIASKTIKYLRINLAKNMKDLYNGKLKSLKEKWRKTPEEGTTSNAHGLEWLILWKWPFYQKWYIDTMQSLWKSQRNSS